MRQRMANFEDAFVAGLLHDIGIVLEDQYVHEHFCRVIQDINDAATLSEVEQSRLGFDHGGLARGSPKAGISPK